MSLENGILGYLSIRPMSGYDIKKLFNLSAAYFWPADQAQIYRSLKKLLSDGQIELHGISRGDGPERKEYAITEKGQGTLHDWLIHPSQTDFISRLSYIMQLFFSGLLSGEDQLRFLDEQLRINQGILQQLEFNCWDNIKAYTETAKLSEDDIRLTSSVWACKWGMLRCKAYTELLEEMKADIRKKRLM